MTDLLTKESEAILMGNESITYREHYYLITFIEEYMRFGLKATLKSTMQVLIASLKQQQERV